MKLFDDKKKVKAVRLIAVSVGICAVLSVALYILFKQFFGGDGQNGGQAFRELVRDNPVIGAVVLVAASIIQVIIAFIPGELLEQAAGYLFGTWMGALLCLVGNMIGSVLVILIVRKFGRNLVYAIYPKEKIENVSFLGNKKKRNILTAVLFFIPGTPKDLLTYLVGLTDMSIPVYVLLTSFARIPSILMSTVSGNWIADMIGGEAVLKKVLFWNAAAIAVCIAGYIVYLFISRGTKKKKKLSDADNVSSNETHPDIPRSDNNDGSNTQK